MEILISLKCGLPAIESTDNVVIESDGRGDQHFSGAQFNVAAKLYKANGGDRVKTIGELRGLTGWDLLRAKILVDGVHKANGPALP